MKNKKKGFVKFIGSASKGRILGAVMCWIAAVLLVVMMFTPYVKVVVAQGTAEAILVDENDVAIPAAEEDLDMAISDMVLTDYSDAEKPDEVWTALKSFFYDEDPADEGHNVRMVDHLTAAYGGAASIVLLVVYCVLIVTAIVCSLFTMNIVSLVAILLAILEAVLVSFISVGGLVDKLNVAAAELNISIQSYASPAFVAIVLMVVAAVVAVVGVILHNAIPEKSKEYDDEDIGWTETSIGGSEDTTGLYVVAKLVQLNTGKTFELMDNNEVVLGKNQQEADVIIQNSVVSRKHAKLVCKNGTFTLVDLNALNGTYVNDEKLAPGGSKQLYGGEYITLGNEILQFVV